MLKGLVLSSMVAAMAVPTAGGAAPIDTKASELENENQVQYEINMDELGIKADEAFELDLSALDGEDGEAVEFDFNLDMDALGIKADEAFELDLSVLGGEDDEASKTDTKLSEKQVVIDMEKEGIKADEAFEFDFETLSVVKK